MNYEEDELERMRARREERRNARKSGRADAGNSRGSRRSQAAGGRSGQDTEDVFKSGYSGPKNQASRGTGSHKRRRSTQQKKKKRMLLMVEIFLVLLCIVAGAGIYLYQKTFGSLQKIEFSEDEVMNVELSEEQLESMKGYMNIACFGVDSRMVGGKQNVGKGTNADVNLIASVNLETGEIRLVSVFRDSYLNINDKNSYNKINAAYAQGGPEQAVKALNKNLGLNITQYATFNWKAVADAINILGGVDIHLSESEFSWINAYITETVKETGVGSVQLTHAGDVHLDGVQAVAYGRLRLGDTDYARTERQRIILAQAFEKAKKADWNTLNCIIETIMPQLATNITPADLIPLARNITKYHMGETAGFPSARGEMDIGKIGDCVVPQTLEFNVKELHRFLFDEEDYEVPSNVKEYSNYIAKTTGLTSEGKIIGHVPVDKGISANSYIKKKAQKVSQQAAEESQKVEESTDETDESETGEGEDPEEIFDPEEEWESGEWEEWFEETENTGNGPGSSAQGPGSSNIGNSVTKPGSGSSRPGSETEKPGSTEEETEETKKNESPGESVPAKPGTSGPTVPGGSSNAGNSAAPGGSGTSGGTTTPGGSGTSGGITTPGGSGTSGGTITPGGSTAPGSSVIPGGNTSSGETEGPSGPGL